MRIFWLITLFIYSSAVISADTCSRVAVINHQEVLVDPSSSSKGEGLRNYLEKDKIALDYFKTYREDSGVNLKTAATSTLGTAMLIYGALQDSESDESSNLFEQRQTYMVGGLGLILLSYFVSKTYQYNNEKNLDMAVKEYNKRNNPKIYFSPYYDVKGSSGGLGLGVSKDF